MRLLLWVLLTLPLLPAAAQPVGRQDTLRLEALRAAAARQDPRAVQPALIARAAELRLAAVRAQRLPQFTLTGQATLQSEVAEIPIQIPGQDLPSPPYEQFRTQIEADWTLYDGGRTDRLAAAERARAAESVAGVAVTLYALREATTEAFFGALLAETRARTFVLTAEDLGAQLRVVRERSVQGAALPAEAAALEAELIRIRQGAKEAEAARRAALGVLAQLTGTHIRPSDTLALPGLDEEVARVRAGFAGEGYDAPLDTAASPLLGRPELVRLGLAAERAEAEARVIEAQARPSVSLFGQAGLGRPSPFNFLSDDLAGYGLVGVRLRWSVFDGRRVRREAEAARVQARLAETEAAAFVRHIMREIEDELAALSRLEAALEDDRRAVALREEVLAVARRQLEEGVLLPDAYTDRLTDLAEARLTLDRHRIERVQAQVRLLSTLGRYAAPHPADGLEALPNFER